MKYTNKKCKKIKVVKKDKTLLKKDTRKEGACDIIFLKLEVKS